MRLEGELRVRVDTQAGRVVGLAATADRARVGPALFTGRRAAEVPALARSIFSLCGRAHASAARAATQAVEGLDAGHAEAATRERTVAAESLQEHAWKFLVEAPRMLGREPAIEAMAEGRRAIAALMDPGADVQAAARALRAWSRGALFEPASFLELSTEEGLRAWMREARTPTAATSAEALAWDAALGASDVDLLPAANPGWIAGELAAEIEARQDFDAFPSLAGRARETGAIARVGDHPLVIAVTRAWGRGVGTRWVARLVEAAQLVLGIQPAPRHGAVAIGAGRGLGWAETARGLLVHGVVLDGDRVAGYRIVAPTEWNFHPDGAFTRSAPGIEGTPDAIVGKVRRLVASLDPCVGVRYEVRHA